MKKLIFLFAILIMAVSVNAQTITQYFKSDKYFDVNGKSYYFGFTKESNPRMLVPLCPVQDCNEYYIILTKKKAKHFLDILKGYQKKLVKWQNTADKEHVTDLTKYLGQTYYHGTMWPKYEFAYTVNNTLYTIELTALTVDYSMVPAWYLEIDSNGQCFVSVESILPTQTFTNNESLGTVNNYGGASVTKKTISIKPAGKNVMNKDNLQWFINTIQELMVQLDESKKENKKSKLFN